MKSMKLPALPVSESELPEAAEGCNRRVFLRRVGLGALLAGLAGELLAAVRALVPNVLYEAPRTYKIGLPEAFAEGVTYIESHRLFIGRDPLGVYAISAVCTHLGCTVKMLNLEQPELVKIGGKPTQIAQEFHCPCHGSKYYGDGTNYAGPAPRPLEWFRLHVSPDDGQIVVNSSETVPHNFRLKA